MARIHKYVQTGSRSIVAWRCRHEGTGVGVIATRYRVSSRGDVNVLKLMLVIAG